MTSNDFACEPYTDQLAELALGILPGRERAAALAHVETCMRCTTELERLSNAADALLAAAPHLDPPLGFEVRVFDRLGLTATRGLRTRRRRLAIGAGALVTLLGAFGLGTVVASEPHELPAKSATASTDVDTAQLVASGKAIGAALAYSGKPGWLLMSVVDLRGDEAVDCSIVTQSGRSIPMGKFWLSNGAGTWSVKLPIAPSDVERVVLTAANGALIGKASFRS
jgi:hypothetical protein